MLTFTSPDATGRRARLERAVRPLAGLVLASVLVSLAGCELRRVPDGAWRLRARPATRSAEIGRAHV